MSKKKSDYSEKGLLFCEVDYIYWVIRDLPDLEIWQLRDDLLPLLARPLPLSWPLPDPPPCRCYPGLIDPSPENIAVMNDRVAAVAFDPQPDPPVEMELISAESLRKISWIVE